MDKRVTIKDIATQVGVSSTTVSAVLGGGLSASVRVSEGTRERILAVAKELRYRPNHAARSLRSSRTNIVGMYAAPGYLTPYVPFTGQIIGGLHQGCDENRKDLLLHGSYGSRPPHEIYTELADGRVDGLIVYTAPTDPLVALLAQSTLPAVAIIDALPGVPSVVADDGHGSDLVARHLAERGHRWIYYRSGASHLISAVRRRHSFLDAAENLGLKVTESYSADHHERFADGELDWLDRPRDQRPTAAVCWNDNTAYNLLGECRRRQMSLPGDLAVVGFDDIPPPHAMPWRLTTVRAPWVDAVRLAITLLVRRMEGQEVALETALPVKLIPGDTT